MSWLRSLVGLSVVVAVFVLGLLFTLAIDALVPLNLLIVELPEQRLATWLILAFFCGGLSGLAAASVLLLKYKTKTLRMQRKLTNLETTRNKMAGSRA